MSSGASRYFVEVGDASRDRERVLAVWRAGGLIAAGGEALAIARYDWFYLHNPAGLAVPLFLCYGPDNVDIGFVGLGPRMLSAGDRQLRAAVLVDFVVVAEHRTALPALLLQRKAREIAFHGCDVVFGVPGPKAVAVLRRLGCHRILAQQVLTRVVSPRDFLPARFPLLLRALIARAYDLIDSCSIALLLGCSSYQIERAEQPDGRFDDLWQRLAPTMGIAGGRDREFLAWRFSSHTGRRYSIYTIRSNRRSADIKGYFVFEQREGVWHIKDFLCVDTWSAPRAAFLMAVRVARRAGIKRIVLPIHASASVVRAARWAGFFRHGQQTCFISGKDPQLADLVGAADWYLTQADEDI